MVDISSNISENLSFYIDGKIVSTSAVSNCEVIEMNSGGSAVIWIKCCYNQSSSNFTSS